MSAVLEDRPAPAPTTPIALSVRGLCKSFGPFAVTQSVDLDLPEGSRLGLIGPNGAGKTTLINLLTGTLRHDKGSIVLEGTSLDRAKPEERVRRGLVRTHQINTLLNETAARENVAIAVAERDKVAWRMLRYSPQWRRCLEEADLRLRDIGIGDIGHRLVKELPYGQQRLLEIAIALAMRPRVLLLDEPAAGVPSSETHVIHEALDRLPAEMAILIIEHDMDLVFRFARDIVVLVQGKVLTRGKPTDIAADPQVRAVYLGKSSTQ
jgi:branched-chain amino acid transport system ATP-binding protein